MKRLEIKKSYTTQDGQGESLKKVIDKYINDNITNEKMISTVHELVSFNKDKFFPNLLIMKFLHL